MKKSRSLPLVLAMVLLLLMAFPLGVFGAEIVVEYPDGFDLGGKTFKAYKIFDVTTDGQDHYAYTLDSDFAAFTDYPTYGLGQTLLEYLGSGSTDLSFNSPQMTAIATNLWRYVEANSIPFEQQATGESYRQDVTFKNLPAGYYLVYSLSTVDNDVTVVAACSLVTATDLAVVTVEPKVDVPTINDVKILNHAYTNDASTLLAVSEPALETPDPASHRWRDWTDASIGDTMLFRVRSQVPEMTGYETNGYIFTVHGQVERGLTFFKDSVEVRVNGVLINSNNYTVDTSGNTFEIKFDPMKFVDSAIFPTGKEIIITYSAGLNGNAEIGAAANTSTVYLEYSNDPYDARAYNLRSTGESVRFVSNVFTFEVELFKFYGADKALAHAKFKLKNSAGNVLPLILVEDAAASSNPNTNPSLYRLAMPSETGITEVETPISGLVFIQGLDAGTYSLEETRAPDGFNKLLSEIAVKIVHTDRQGAFTVNGASSHTVKVENHGGPVLPATGGFGTTVFYIVSAVLTAFLVVFFVSRRRKYLLKG